MSYTIKEGANNPSLVVFLFDNFGEPEQAPLQGLDGEGVVITFVFREGSKGDTDLADLIAPGVNYVDPAVPATYQNAAQHLWEQGETKDLGAGDINFEIEVEWSPGQIEKFPNSGYFTFKIEPDLRGSATAT